MACLHESLEVSIFHGLGFQVDGCHESFVLTSEVDFDLIIVGSDSESGGIIVERNDETVR